MQDSIYEINERKVKDVDYIQSMIRLMMVEEDGINVIRLMMLIL